MMQLNIHCISLLQGLIGFENIPQCILFEANVCISTHDGLQILAAYKMHYGILERALGNNAKRAYGVPMFPLT